MTTTTNLGLTLPTVGADDDTWGTIQNTLSSGIDAVFKADGTGTSVGIKVGSGKTLNALDGTVVLGDAGLSIKDTTDATKILALQCSGITTGTTRTLTIPDASGTISLASPTTVQVLTSGTSATYTPTTGAKYIKATIIGAGGGGGGSGGEGQGSGGAGGTTSFDVGGTPVSSAGGAGGINYGGGAGGTGGAGTADYTQNGAPGSCVFAYPASTTNTSTIGGNGGGLGAGLGGFAGAAGAAALANSGAGGGGGGTASSLHATLGYGGGGGSGQVRVKWYAAASYTYTIGAAGAAGAAGTTGYVGGAGGSGVIIVEEFY